MARVIFISEVSLPGPLPGQSSRSSDNFDLDRAPSNATNYYFEVDSPLAPGDIPNIVFDVVDDISSGADKILYGGIRNGYTGSVKRDAGVYIVYKSGATKPFRVKIFATV
ncbi:MULTISPECIES: hypothetical protein [Bacillus cereus group]|uniref:hypothetical protein n=1 Tax=Bacillus cereus group TaxID=86661 RepID=UPI0007B6F4CB|nr:hypothetical protein [Bacillus cereus]ANC11391.1 hypothetical protein WR47_30395 [Bacillus cereus]ANC16843.1 hypothetical protein WR51_28270 [Bacillus cereus]MDA1996838.1 hypothetical protein [Bacillus cereus]MDA2002664.1 hypothetical protein [Bacillus cereus]MDA3655476.1 hypothetical protein [Bacillus cereus]